MTREEFVKKARSFGYAEQDINDILEDVDEIMMDAPECFEFNYDNLPLFEQPLGDI